MATCQQPCFGHCREKQCPLFVEDLKWIDEINTNAIALVKIRRHQLPFDFENNDAKTASTLERRPGETSPCRPVEKHSRNSSSLLPVTSAERGFPRVQNYSALIGKPFNPTLTKIQRCNYCGGPIDPGQEYRVTHLKKVYHPLCFEYVLQPEDARRRLPHRPP
jgi:hypothetical protein